VKIKRKLAVAAFDQTFVEEALVAIVVCADEAQSNEGYGNRGVTLYYLQDAVASIQNILLAAHAFGLSTCWIGAFREG
jgi:nitroreductase